MIRRSLVRWSDSLIQAANPYRRLFGNAANLAEHANLLFRTQLQHSLAPKSSVFGPYTGPARLSLRHTLLDQVGRVPYRRFTSCARQKNEKGPGGEREHLDPTKSQKTVTHFRKPTKEELLAAASGFWQRFRIRFKYFMIRSYRPFNWDEISAFFSWLVLGHLVWVVVGTTTFFSLAIVGINTVSAQEHLAQAIGKYLTKETGITVVFESAIVPKWKDGSISFKNVYVSRRPKPSGSKTSFRKGSLVEATNSLLSNTSLRSEKEEVKAKEDDGNYTQFDLTIANIDVTFSFARWFNGKGIVKAVDIKGVRGVVDRTHVHWDPQVNPRSLKHKHNWGDFEMESVKLEDLLVTVHHPQQFRPFEVSVFSCDLPRLRKQWLFWDLLSATHMTGSYDRSLFTLHPKQSFAAGSLEHSDAGERKSCLRIDNVNIDHLNRGVNGPFGWIYRGTVDFLLDITFPSTNGDSELSAVVNGIMDNIGVVTRSEQEEHRAVQARESQREDRNGLNIDMRIQLNDVKAAVPIFTNELSYANNALIRPIVAYINSRRTHVPLHCQISKKLSDFDGSWTIFDCGLMDDVSAEVYEEFVRTVHDQQTRKRRLQKVGFWSMQLATQLLLISIRSFSTL